MEQCSVIYCWINKLNGMMYVGQSKNVKQRLSHYKGDHHKEQPKFYNATQKHGWENFTFEIIEGDIPKNKLNEREVYWIDCLHTFDTHDTSFGYNLTSGGDSPEFISTETKAKMSKARKGHKTSKETKAKISVANSGNNNWAFGKTGEKSHNFGRKASAEAKKKQSEAHKGKILSEEHKIKITEGQRHKMKPVECIDTGAFFESERDCSRKMNISSGALHEHLQGKYKHIKGLHFRYIEKCDK